MSRVIAPPVGAPIAAGGRLIAPTNTLPVMTDALATFITATADSTSHVKGAWVEAFASTSADADFVYTNTDVVNTNGADTRLLFDIGVGGAGSEVVVAANIPAGYCYGYAASGSGLPSLIPVRIPKGSRVAYRCQALVSADTVRIMSALYASPLDLAGRSPSSVDMVGADAATSTSTIVFTASDTYYELTAATTQPYRALQVHITGTSNSLPTATPVITVGVGASGSEVEVGTRTFNSSTFERLSNLLSEGIPSTIVRHIPKGSRIAVKSSSASTALGAVVIGVPYS